MKESDAVKIVPDAKLSFDLRVTANGRCIAKVYGSDARPAIETAERIKAALTTSPLSGDYAELVERLNNDACSGDDWPDTMLFEAANAITALQHRLAEVEGALQQANVDILTVLGACRDNMDAEAVRIFQRIAADCASAAQARSILSTEKGGEM